MTLPRFELQPASLSLSNLAKCSSQAALNDIIQVDKVRFPMQTPQYNKCTGVENAFFSLSYIVLHCPTPSYTVLHCPTLSYTVLHCPTLSYTVLHCPTLPCTVLHCQHCTTLPCTVLHCPTLSYTVLHCPTLSYTVLHCPTLSYTVLHCPTLSYTVLHCPPLSYTVLHCHAQQIISPTSLAPNILHPLLIQRVVNTWQGVQISHSPCISSSNIPKTRQHIFSS